MNKNIYQLAELEHLCCYHNPADLDLNDYRVLHPGAKVDVQPRTFSHMSTNRVDPYHFAVPWLATLPGLQHLCG